MSKASRRARAFTAALGFVIVLTSGCAHPGILVKGIGAKGAVLDQFDDPVPNASMVAIRRHCIPIFPFNFWIVAYALNWRTEKPFRADEDGSWKYRTRNITTFKTLVNAVGTNGYRGMDSTGYLNGLYDKRKNVVLRLKKNEASTDVTQE